jgi:tetratricopeptide (TPR) repeat protein
MPDQLIHLRTRGPLGRALLLLPIALALLGAWFSVRWYIGDTIAEYMNAEDRGVETARIAASLAPNDPLAHWRVGDIEHNTLPPDQIDQATSEYEQAVALSPNDYRFWLALGRALEESGDAQKSEKAMRRAVELAPSYSYPRWYLGNLLLRSGHNAEAFAELRRASEADPQLQPQVFNLALQIYAQNYDELKNAIGPSAGTRAAFAKYLIDGKKIDEALRVWNDLNSTEKKENRTTGDFVIKSLMEAKHYRQVLAIWNDLAPTDGSRGVVGQLLNGGFEQNIDPANAGVFGWKIKSTQQAQVAIEALKHHSGGHSLRIVFQSRAKLDSLNVSQLVVVESDKQYDLEGFLKTSQLESAGTPVVEIVDAADGTVLGTSPSAPAGDNDWQPITITFKTGAKTEAIGIRINRASCGDNPSCPIFGTLWYDDFNLKRKS